VTDDHPCRAPTASRLCAYATGEMPPRSVKSRENFLYSVKAPAPPARGAFLRRACGLRPFRAQSAAKDGGGTNEGTTGPDRPGRDDPKPPLLSVKRRVLPRPGVLDTEEVTGSIPVAHQF
jgi:hypothetical protein